MTRTGAGPQAWAYHQANLATPARKEDLMSRLIRMDHTGHSTVAEWSSANPESVEAAVRALRRELDSGAIAVVSEGEGQARQVRELPVDADTVILRRPIAGG